MNQPAASLTLILERFDQAWHAGSVPDIRQFLPTEVDDMSAPQRRRVLCELVMVDLEFRWKSAGGQQAVSHSGSGSILPQRPLLEDYVAQYGELGPLHELPVELIGQEYRIRQAHGDRPNRESYRNRFPGQSSLLEAELDRGDVEEASKATVAMPHSQLGGRESEKSTLPLGAPQRHSKSATPAMRFQRPGAESGPDSPIRAFGDYELVQEIARGGMGVVFKARQVRLNRVVAIKMILAGHLANQEEVQRFYAEAEAAANLDHPGIVPIYEIGEQEGQHYFSMAFVEGRSLADVVKAGPIPPRRAAEYALKIAEAIAFAHGKGVIHRDLKPGNVLIDSVGQPKVTDFGLAKRVEGNDGLTATGQVLGTPSYMPPEQAAGRIKDVTQSADVYSLGAILYCLLTGRPPFQAASVVETLQLVLNSEPVRPRALNPSLPRDLETICLKCLQKSPVARYRSADDMADDLRRYLAGEPIVARPMGNMERAWRWCRRRPLAAALGASLVVVVLVSAGAIAMNRQAQLAQQETERAHQLAALQMEFDSKIDQPALGGDYLLAMELLTSNLERLDLAQGQDARMRFLRRYSEYITGVIHRPRITDEEGAAVRSTLQQFARLDEARSASLTADLERNWRQWKELFRLRPPFDNVNEVFPPKVLSAVSGRLVCSPKPVSEGRALFLFTNQASAGDVELDAVFRGPWRKSPKLILGIDGRQKEGWNGYHFIMHPAVTDEVLAKAKAAGGMCFELASHVVLEIRSEEDTLQRKIVPLDALGTGEQIRLHVARHDREYSFQVNDLPPLAAEEMFRMAPAAGGVFMITDMRGPQLSDFILEELSARSRQTSAGASPLAAGDQLYGKADYSAALEQYRLQSRTAKEPAFRNESRFKEGLCLSALKREGEALEVFSELFSAGDPRWSTQAACQLWLLYLEAGKLPEADAVMVNLSATHQFEDLAAIVPLKTMDRVMERVRNQTLQSGNDPRRLVEHLERLVNSLQLLGADGDRIYNARIDLLMAYELAGDAQKVYGVARQLLASAGGRYFTIRDIPADYARLALQFGDSNEALRTLSDLLLDPQTQKPRLNRLSLFIERAMLLAARQEWTQVRDEVEKFQALREEARQAGGNVWDHYVDAAMLGSILLGFAHEHLGDAEAAKREWSQGFKLAREHGFPDSQCWDSGILGSLSGELTEQDVGVMVDKLTSGLPVALLTGVRNRVVAVSFLTSVTKNTWHTPIGREALYNKLWGTSLQRESIQRMIAAMFHEIGREIVLGPGEAAGELSPEQAAILKALVSDVLEGHRQGQLAESHAVQSLLTYNGNLGIFGWGGLAPRLPAKIRGPAAYMFACHFWHQKNKDAARALLDAAAKDAPPEGELRVLVDALRQKTAEP